MLNGFKNRQMNIGAVDNPIRSAKTLAKFFVGFNAHDFGAVDRIHHDDVIGKYRSPARCFAGTQGIQRVEGIRTQLNARTYFADLRGLLKQQYLDPLARQRQRGGQTAYAAANYDNFLFCFLATHLISSSILSFDTRYASRHQRKSRCRPAPGLSAHYF
jgi:hypothetical protein